MITTSRLYRDYETGARVVTDLERAGIPHTDISIVASKAEADGATRRIDRDADGTDDRVEGATTGAGIGASLGGVAGLLAGLGMLAIPGIGPVVAAGWLASMAAMAAAGGATGGLIGALTQSGIGKDEAQTYAEGIRRGGTLVSVRANENQKDTVEAIMQRHNPTDARSSSAAYLSSNPMAESDNGPADDRIIAVFENSERARAAREALIAADVDNAQIELLDNRSDLDNWTAIKQHAVPDEDSHLYAEGLGRGHSILVVQASASEHDRIMQVIGRFNPIDIDDHSAQWRTAGWSGIHPGKAAWDARKTSTPTSASPVARGTEEQVIPVYEEKLRVGKRVVEGHVRVHVYTVEHPVQEGLTLREEHVAVERRAVDRPVSGTPGEAFGDRTIDVTTHREEPVVSKEARVKEEIVVRKEADQRTETVRDNVRHTEVEVDDHRAKTATAAPSAPSVPKR